MVIMIRSLLEMAMTQLLRMVQAVEFILATELFCGCPADQSAMHECDYCRSPSLPTACPVPSSQFTSLL